MVLGVIRKRAELDVVLIAMIVRGSTGCGFWRCCRCWEQLLGLSSLAELGAISQSVSDLDMAFLFVQKFDQRVASRVLILFIAAAGGDSFEKADRSAVGIPSLEFPGNDTDGHAAFELGLVAAHVSGKVGMDQASESNVPGILGALLVSSAKHVEWAKLGNGGGKSRGGSSHTCLDCFVRIVVFSDPRIVPIGSV